MFFMFFFALMMMLIDAYNFMRILYRNRVKDEQSNTEMRTLILK